MNGEIIGYMIEATNGHLIPCDLPGKSPSAQQFHHLEPIT